jgi:hypothetical protein
MRPTFVSMNVTTQNDNATSDQTTTMPTMAGETGRDLCERRGELSGNARRNIERRWLSLFGMSFSVFEMYDPETVAKYEAAFPLDLKSMRLKRTAPVRIAAGKPPTPNEVSVEPLPTGKKWLLWACFALSASCSIPNMFSVMEAIKGNEVLAAIVTSAFTVAPFLLIGYGVRGASHLVVYVVIGVEVFCNAAGFYGGMTGLSHSLYTAPTLFLHMVTSMTNSGNEGTALLLAFFMAICIALLAVVPVYELGKPDKK